MSTHAAAPQRPLAVGDEAPNFDLTSTADVLLMLRDEVPRTAVVLFGFVAVDDGIRADLRALAARSAALAARQAKVLAISAAPLTELKSLQSELALPFPLLHDDRGFLGVYGIGGGIGGKAEIGESGGVAAGAPGLFLVDRGQRLAWIAPAADGGRAAGSVVEAAWPQIQAALAKLPGPTSGVPGSVINRLVRRRVR